MQAAKIFDRKFFALHKAGLAIATACMASAPAAAQHWATPEACRVDSPRVIESAFGGDADLITQMASQEINATGRLWKITAPNGKTSHLWGTYHSNDPVILSLPPELRTVLAQAKTVASEYNPIPPSRRVMERQFDDNRLWRHLRTAHTFSLPNKQVQGWIETRLIAMGYGAKIADSLSDLGIAEALLADPCNDFRNGIFPIQDDRILLLGAVAGATITGLEDPDAFRTTISRNDRADLARAMIEVYGAYLNPEGVNDARSTGFALYLQGQIGMMRAWDSAYIANIYGQARGAQLAALVNGYLVDERNLTFLKNALPLINEGHAVLAVGAFHLPGPNGMVALLRAEGHRVERVVTAGEIP